MESMIKKRSKQYHCVNERCHEMTYTENGMCVDCRFVIKKAAKIMEYFYKAN